MIHANQVHQQGPPEVKLPVGERRLTIELTPVRANTIAEVSNALGKIGAEPKSPARAVEWLIDELADRLQG